MAPFSMQKAGCGIFPTPHFCIKCLFSLHKNSTRRINYDSASALYFPARFLEQIKMREILKRLLFSVLCCLRIYIHSRFPYLKQGKATIRFDSYFRAVTPTDDQDDSFIKRDRIFLFVRYLICHQTFTSVHWQAVVFRSVAMISEIRSTFHFLFLSLFFLCFCIYFGLMNSLRNSLCFSSPINGHSRFSPNQSDILMSS